MFTTTGATLHMHYCMGKLVESGLWHSKSSDDCSYCGMEKKQNDCCKDEQHFIKNSSDQKIATTIVIVMQAPVIVKSMISSKFNEPVIAPVADENYMANAPPRTGVVPTHIINCVFLV